MNVDNHVYSEKCPFCGKEHEQRAWLNIICDCGAKYYLIWNVWIDRKTGERKFGKQPPLSKCKREDDSDFVLVVRCKDCKHRGEPLICPMCREEFYFSDDGGDVDIIDETEDEGFCHVGERNVENESY